MLGVISSWLTPTVLFCVTNLVIATIFLSSNSNSRKNSGPDPTRPLARAPSLIERVQSINFNLYNTDPTHHLTRSPSLLERVRSFNFNLHNTDNSYSDPRDHDPTRELTRAPSLLERVRSIKFSPFNAEQPEPETHNETQTLLTRTPSTLERVWFNFSPHKTDSEGTDAGGPGPSSEEAASATGSARIRKSRSEKMKEKEGSPERRRPATVKERKPPAMDGEDERVDEKADDFINRFKQQLKLQRLDSILRYKEMLSRGA